MPGDTGNGTLGCPGALMAQELPGERGEPRSSLRAALLAIDCCIGPCEMTLLKHLKAQEANPYLPQEKNYFIKYF